MNHLLLVGLAGLLFLSGCVSSEYASRDTSAITPTAITSFQVFPNSTICEEDGKPIIRLFSTTTCPHCRWIKETINGVMEEYVEQDKIVAYHWNVDTGDNQLTSTRETTVPEDEVALFRQFNPNFSVPTYVFGCKYYRVGNAYEVQDDLDAEAGEFKAVIEKLLEETTG